MTAGASSLSGVPAGTFSEQRANGLRPFQRGLCRHRGLQQKLVHCFTNSVCALLGALAGAIFSCNLARAMLVEPRDPPTALPTNAMFWILGTAALAVAVACVYMRRCRLRLGLVLWFATNVIIYRVGLECLGIHSVAGYVAGLAHTFNLSSGLAVPLLNLLFSYLFVGSTALLLWDCLLGPEEVQLKATCRHCGGRIAFLSRSLGQRILCPHCSKEITLHKPGMRKMSCYFCKGHIEFPLHAIGEKTHCPHCKMDITLREPT